jgi:hypothetical protein
VNEQNSLEVAWEMFMDESYVDLRACLFKTQEELDRFRQLAVNAVIATDLFDKELKSARNNRWRKAFVCDSKSVTSFNFSMSSLDSTDDMDLKATVVLEHMLQAADIFHTMQSFDIFIDWNERFFHECYHAYLTRRADLEPGGWYNAELSFFDEYAIPLAAKLKECGLFGYNGEEYLRNAKRNRLEWERKGKDYVPRFIKSYKKPAS